MTSLYDEDGIDGPFEKGMAKPIKVEMIYGYPFGPDPKHPDLNDWAQCLTCGQVVDVGGELRAHVNDHNAEKYENQ